MDLDKEILNILCGRALRYENTDAYLEKTTELIVEKVDNVISQAVEESKKECDSYWMRTVNLHDEIREEREQKLIDQAVSEKLDEVEKNLPNKIIRFSYLGQAQQSKDAIKYELNSYDAGYKDGYDKGSNVCLSQVKEILNQAKGE